MAFVTGGDGLQNRTGLVGNAIGWCTIWPSLGVANQLPVFPQEFAHLFQGMHAAAADLPGPAYDLLGKRRVQRPIDVMVGQLVPPVRDAFFNDTDYDIVQLGITRRFSRIAGGAGPIEAESRLYLIGTLDEEAGIELAGLRCYAGVGAVRRVDEDILVRLLDAEDNEIGRGTVAFVMVPKVEDRDPVFESAHHRLFEGEVAYHKATRTIVIERQGCELKRLPVPTRDPEVHFLGEKPKFDDDPAELKWEATDPEGHRLYYDVGLVYPSAGRTIFLAGNLEVPNFRLQTTLLPGGEDVELRIVATNGFAQGEARVTGLRVPDRPPRVTILAPLSGDTYLASALVPLSATVWDPQEDPHARELVRWTSDRDGDLGRGSEAIVRLSPGAHVITAEAFGGAGAVGSARATVVMR